MFMPECENAIVPLLIVPEFVVVTEIELEFIAAKAGVAVANIAIDAPIARSFFIVFFIMFFNVFTADMFLHADRHRPV